MTSKPHHAIRKLLVANRSEFAFRVMRSAAEPGIRSVATYAAEEGFSLHRFKADESCLVGEGKKPITAYLDIQRHHPHRARCRVDAIQSGRSAGIAGSDED